jgi:hypothetical protein
MGLANAKKGKFGGSKSSNWNLEDKIEQLLNFGVKIKQLKLWGSKSHNFEIWGWGGRGQTAFKLF